MKNNENENPIYLDRYLETSTEDVTESPFPPEIYENGNPYMPFKRNKIESIVEDYSSITSPKYIHQRLNLQNEPCGSIAH